MGVPPLAGIDPILLAFVTLSALIDNFNSFFVIARYGSYKRIKLISFTSNAKSVLTHESVPSDDTDCASS